MNINLPGIKSSGMISAIPEPPFLNKEKSISIIEYVENELSDFRQKPFSATDSLVLSQIAYMNLEGVVSGVEYDSPPVSVRSLYRAELFDRLFGNIRAGDSNRRLLSALAASPRYRDIGVAYYINTIDDVLEKQFSAVTFFLPTGETYIAYRGTDATITGWKEDFDLFFQEVIPGQISAVHYMETVAARTAGGIYAGGHSKGGNLALYGASFAPPQIQSRIITVFNHDGPGLSQRIKDSDGYTDISEKVNTTIPEESFFGLMFNHGDYQVVQSDRMGIMQHDPFSWLIQDGDFVYLPEVKQGFEPVVNSMYELTVTLSEEDRNLFIDTLFDLFRATGVNTFKQIGDMGPRAVDSVVNRRKSVDPQTSKKVRAVMAEFLRTLGRNIIRLPNLDKLKDFISKHDTE